MSTLDAANIIERNQINLNYGAWLAEVHTTVVNILNDKFMGKKITKRIAQAVQDAIPDCDVFYSTEYQMFKLRIARRNSSNWGERDIAYVFLGYATDPYITKRAIDNILDGIKYLDQTNAKAGAVASGEIAQKVAEWNDLFAQVDAIKAWADKNQIIGFGY